jgi:hypothetical protein
MRRTTDSVLRRGALSVGLAVLACGPALAQAPDPQVERILAAWRGRQERFQSVRYRVAGEIILPKGSAVDDSGQHVGDDVPPHDISCDLQRVLLLDFKNNRHRLEEKKQICNPRTGLFHPEMTIIVCDGKTLTGLTPREENTSPNYHPAPENPDVTITSGNLEKIRFPAVLIPLFLGHGIVNAGRTASNRPGRLKSTPNAEEFSVQGTAVHEGRPCVVVRTEAQRNDRGALFDELWIDVERDGAVVRQADINEGQVLSSFDIRYRQTPQGWLPDSWDYVVGWSEKPGRTQIAERIHVEEVTADPPVSDADFRVDVRPGMKIHQTTLTGTGPISEEDISTKTFRVGPDGTWNEVVNGVEQPPSRPWLWWAAGLLLIPAAVLGAWFVWRRRCRNARGPEAAA